MKHAQPLNLIFTLLLAVLLPYAALSQGGVSEGEKFVEPNQAEIDSLLSITHPEELLTTSNPDSLYREITWNYSRIAYLTCNNDTCLKYAFLSNEYCKESNPNYERRLAANYTYIAFAYYCKDESRNALEYRFKAAEQYNKLSEKREEALQFVHIANCYEDLNIRDSIFYYYNKAISYFTETHDTVYLIRSYSGLGRVYSNMELCDNALKNYQKSLDYAILLNDTSRMVTGYNQVGKTQYQISDTLIGSAIENLSRSVRLSEALNSKKYSDISNKYEGYSNLAKAYIKAARLTGISAYADSCHMCLKRIGNYYQSIAGTYNYVVDYGYTYVEYLMFYKRYNDALAELLKVEKYITDGSLTYALSDYHQRLYEVYSLLGDYRNALKHHEKYMEYKMAFVNDSTLNTIKDAEVERTHMLDSVNHHYETLRIEAEHQNEMQHTRIRTRVITIVAILIILVGVIMFFFYKATKENEENKLRNKALETERSLLRTQMNPHFIFNALNSVQNYIISNNAQEAVRFLSKFAKLMRMILNNSMVQMVTLSDELQSLSLYLDLERARFGNKFSYSIDVSDEVEEDIVSVPPMLIQPFIENAIIHGLMHKTDGEGLITVSISENDRDSLVCRITDNGIGRKAAAEVEKNVGRKHKSVGMQLTRDRLRDLNSEANAKLSCVIDDLEDEAGHALGTRVTIVIPVV